MCKGELCTKKGPASPIMSDEMSPTRTSSEAEKEARAEDMVEEQGVTVRSRRARGDDDLLSRGAPTPLCLVAAGWGRTKLTEVVRLCSFFDSASVCRRDRDGRRGRGGSGRWVRGGWQLLWPHAPGTGE